MRRMPLFYLLDPVRNLRRKKFIFLNFFRKFQTNPHILLTPVFTLKNVDITHGQVSNGVDKFL